MYERPLTRIIKTQLFGKPYVELGPFIVVASYLYATGAVLGRALHERAATLFTLFSPPGRERQGLQFYVELAEKRLQMYGKEPTSFQDLITTTEYAKAGVRYPPRNYADLKALSRAAGQKIPVREAEWMAAGLFIREGIAFGSSFPELTEKMWRKMEQVQVDEEALTEMRVAGLDVPDRPPEPVTLEDFESDVLTEVAQYMSAKHPALCEQLGLP